MRATRAASVMTLLTLAMATAVVAAPVLTAPAAAARPVSPVVRTIPLTAVADSQLQTQATATRVGPAEGGRLQTPRRRTRPVLAPRRDVAPGGFGAGVRGRGPDPNARTLDRVADAPRRSGPAEPGRRDRAPGNGVHSAAMGWSLGRAAAPRRCAARRVSSRPVRRPRRSGEVPRRRRDRPYAGGHRECPHPTPDDLHPQAVGRGRVAASRPAALHRHDQGRVRPPHRGRQHVLAGRRPRDHPCDLRLPREEPGLV
jgi:hypothetical protein